jgi:uncharacterized protein YbjT (DUF2867 family)
MSKTGRGLFVCAVLLLAAVAASSGYAEDGELVLVAGATGGTGRHVVTELSARSYRVRAFVRDIDEAREKLGTDIDFVAGDVRDRASIDAALDGVTAMISAIGAGRSDPSNGPEFVDYGGVKNLAEAAAHAGLRQFVLVSSSGVTHEDHMLNKMFNNVLIWKFKGEEAVRASGVPYTIVRPGGLINKPSDEAVVVLEQGDAGTGVIPRIDVAILLVEALENLEAINKTFEVYTGETPTPVDWQSRFSALDGD